MYGINKHAGYGPDGRRMLCKSGGIGSSQSQSQTTTNNTEDKRVAVQSGVGVSSTEATINVTSLDAGAINGALQLVAQSDALASQNYRDILGVTAKLFDAAIGTVDKVNQSTGNAYQTATNEKAGSIDNKTIAIIAVAGAAAFAFSRMKK